MAHPKEIAAANREDISQFVVHLTRDDRLTFPSGGATARENFMEIYRDKEIRAFRAHCLHNTKLHLLPESLRDEMKVVCLTEVPLNQLHLLTRSIPGREIELAPYGFVFTKEFILARGAQPAIYINSYGGNTFLREAADDLFERTKGDPTKGHSWKFLPFFNAMHEKYDFTWEREWRVRRKLAFSVKDLVCVILPRAGDADLRERFVAGGLAVISPGWNYGQIVGELARQQRETRRVTLETSVGPKVVKKLEPSPPDVPSNTS